MIPYYQDSLCTIYRGDCRDLVSWVGPIDTLITDPVWPNAAVKLYGSDAPALMFAQMWRGLECSQALPARAAIQLGTDSDPRFLCGVPAALPFFRVASLELVRVHYKGRLMYTGDTAYLFGAPPPQRTGPARHPRPLHRPQSPRPRDAAPLPAPTGPRAVAGEVVERAKGHHLRSVHG